MDIVLWYVLAMATAHAYGFVLRRRFGDTEADADFGVGTGVVWATAIGLLSLAFSAVDFKDVFVGVSGQAALTLAGGLICYQGAYLGVRYWSGSGWQSISRPIPAFLAFVFLALPGTAAAAIVGNLMMTLFCVGAGCLVARRASRRFAYLFFTCLMAFDAYALWYSDIMETMLARVPWVVPAGFVHLNGAYAIGAGDVLFSVLGAMIVMKFCGWRWSAAVCVLYVLAMDPRSLMVLSGILAPSGSSDYFPLMVTICPITMATLAIGGRRAKARA